MVNVLNCAVMVALSAIEPASPCLAADRPQWTATVACPAVWPGSDASNAPLLNASEWTEFVAHLKPSEDGTNIPGGSPSMQIDCAYSGRDAPSRHITIDIPNAVICQGKRIKDGMFAETCRYRPASDGTIGPVRTQIAEPVTLATQIAGFRLRQSRDAVRAQAASAAFAIAEADQLLRLSKTSETVEIAFSRTTGLSRLVTTFVSQDKWTTNPTVVMRFGLFGEFSDVKSRYGWLDRVWINPGQPAVVRYHPDPDAPAAKLSLIDTEAPD